MQWDGPITIDQLLDGVLLPPESPGVYAVSLQPWAQEPTTHCQPLYVGKGDLLKKRIGDLIADLFGFYVGRGGGGLGHHSGGRSLYAYCGRTYVNPKALFIGWSTDCGCHLCRETELYNRLRPKLNKARPSACTSHLY